MFAQWYLGAHYGTRYTAPHCLGTMRRDPEGNATGEVGQEESLYERLLGGLLHSPSSELITALLQDLGTCLYNNYNQHCFSVTAELSPLALYHSGSASSRLFNIA